MLIKLTGLIFYEFSDNFLDSSRYLEVHWGSQIIYYFPLHLKQDAQAQKTLSREGWVGVVPSPPFLPPPISILFIF